jgi:cytochrome P450
MPPFHGDRMRAYGRIIQDLTLAELQRRGVGTPFAAQDLARSIALQVILRAVGIARRRGSRPRSRRSRVPSGTRRRS